MQLNPSDALREQIPGQRPRKRRLQVEDKMMITMTPDLVSVLTGKKDLLTISPIQGRRIPHPLLLSRIITFKVLTSIVTVAARTRRLFRLQTSFNLEDQEDRGKGTKLRKFLLAQNATRYSFDQMSSSYTIEVFT